MTLEQFAHRMAAHAGYTAQPTPLSEEQLDDVARYIDDCIKRLDNLLLFITKTRTEMEGLAP